MPTVTADSGVAVQWLEIVCDSQPPIPFPPPTAQTMVTSEAWLQPQFDSTIRKDASLPAESTITAPVDGGLITTHDLFNAGPAV